MNILFYNPSCPLSPFNPIGLNNLTGLSGTNTNPLFYSIFVKNGLFSPLQYSIYGLSGQWTNFFLSSAKSVCRREILKC